jgi:hypothetical protein
MTRIKKILLGSSLAISGILAFFMFVPWSFEKHSEFYVPVMYHGNRVESYGMSRIRGQRIFVDGNLASGELVYGRCYIVFRRGQADVTVYGWGLSRMTRHDFSRADFEFKWDWRDAF